MSKAMAKTGSGEIFDTAMPETEDILACIERWREDAERYRWLRDQQMYGCWPQVVDGLCRLSGDALDAAVDDAMHPRALGQAPLSASLNLN
ncbi:MAG: hypothetical protein H6943_04695 [Zoogloeaceae bacterium]|nr:hypothetical protein [Zoogloeaceae bacterium]